MVITITETQVNKRKNCNKTNTKKNHYNVVATWTSKFSKNRVPYIKNLLIVLDIHLKN